MPSLTENIKQFLDDLERFITVTIKDLKLTTAQAQEKHHIVERMRAIQELVSTGAEDRAWQLKDYDNNVSVLRGRHRPAGAEDKAWQLKDYDNNVSVLRGRHRPADIEDQPATPTTMTQDVAVVPARELLPKFCGWLLKKRKHGGLKGKLGPQRRWCCIKDGVFYYYTADMSDKQQGHFYLTGYELERLDKFWFRLVRLGGRTFEFQCEDESWLNKWTEALTQAIGDTPSLLTTRTLPARTRDPLPEIPGQPTRQGMFTLPENRNLGHRRDKPLPEPGPEPFITDRESQIYDDTDVAHGQSSDNDSDDYDDVEVARANSRRPIPERPPARIQEQPKSPKPIPLPRSPPPLSRPIPVPIRPVSESDENYDDVRPPSESEENYDDVRPPSVSEENYDDVIAGDDDDGDSDSSGYDDAISSIVPPAHIRRKKGLPSLPGETDVYNSGSMDEGFSSSSSFRSGVSSGAGSTFGAPISQGTGVSPRGPLPPIPQEETGNPSFLHDTTPPRPPPLTQAARPRLTPGSFYKRLYIARHDFHTVKQGELPFRRGDVIKVIDQTFDRHRWWTGTLGSRTGLVPKTYLQKAYKS